MTHHAFRNILLLHSAIEVVRMADPNSYIDNTQQLWMRL